MHLSYTTDTTQSSFIFKQQVKIDNTNIYILQLTVVALHTVLHINNTYKLRLWLISSVQQCKARAYLLIHTFYTFWNRHRHITVQRKIYTWFANFATSFVYFTHTIMNPLPKYEKNSMSRYVTWVWNRMPHDEWNSGSMVLMN